jgi:hypothetical protein
MHQAYSSVNSFCIRCAGNKLILPELYKMQYLASNNSPRGLNTDAAAQYIGFSSGFLRKARRGLTQVPGPQYRRIGNRVVYLREDLDKFLDQFEAES